MTEFNDIKITELDEKASHPSGEGGLVDIVLKLSAAAPSDWASYFNAAWTRHIYMSKRKASVAGSRLEIRCMPDELQDDHIPELNKVIGETNSAYRVHLVEQAALDKAAAAQADADKQVITDLKESLKFD